MLRHQAQPKHVFLYIKETVNSENLSIMQYIQSIVIFITLQGKNRRRGVAMWENLNFLNVARIWWIKIKKIYFWALYWTSGVFRAANSCQWQLHCWSAVCDAILCGLHLSEEFLLLSIRFYPRKNAITQRKESKDRRVCPHLQTFRADNLKKELIHLRKVKKTHRRIRTCQISKRRKIPTGMLQEHSTRSSSISFFGGFNAISATKLYYR